MMPQKYKTEGFLFLDNRDAPPIETPPPAGWLPINNKLFESITNTCSICCDIVIKNPDRTRPRNYHPQTDRYICDKCALFVHNNLHVAPLEKVFDHTQEQNFRKEEGYNPLPILTDTSPLLPPHKDK